MDDMERVINALKQCISTNTTCEGCPYEGTTCTTTLNTDVLNLLKDVALVKHGHWITKTRHEHYPSGKEYEEDFCSACGMRGSLEYTYCPACGCRMDEVTL